jgi:hypothetical protein
MTAAELNEIVKDLIPTAWPEGLTYSVEACDEDGTPESAGEEWKGEAEGVTASIIPAYHAELMFEASMNRRVMLAGGSLHHLDGKWAVRMRRHIENPSPSDFLYTWTLKCASPIEALASACKAQKGAGDV